MSRTSDLCRSQPRPASGSGAQKVSAVELIPVTSSQIAAVGYDPTARQLVIQFHRSGSRLEAIYSYTGVPAQIAAGLIVAASPGTYFHRHIRQGGYPYRRHEGGAP